MSDKNWKNYLLSSGMPLEYSVIKELSRLGIYNLYEFNYERKNESGFDTEFSVDIRASNDSEFGLMSSLMIECKYKHDGTKWIFSPSHLENSSLTIPFVPIDYFTIEKVSPDLLKENFYLPDDVCYKGIEIFNNGANPSSIREATHQLKYSVPDVIIDRTTFQLSHRLEIRKPDLVICLVVTTAELWQMDRDSNILSIRESDALENIAVRKKMVVLFENPSIAYTRFFNEKMTELINLNRDNLSGKKLSKLIADITEYYSFYLPRLFFIVEYSNLLNVLQNLLELLNNENTLSHKTH